MSNKVTKLKETSCVSWREWLFGSSLVSPQISLKFEWITVLLIAFFERRNYFPTRRLYKKNVIFVIIPLNKKKQNALVLIVFQKWKRVIEIAIVNVCFYLFEQGEICPYNSLGVGNRKVYYCSINWMWRVANGITRRNECLKTGSGLDKLTLLAVEWRWGKRSWMRGSWISIDNIDDPWSIHIFHVDNIP